MRPGRRPGPPAGGGRAPGMRRRPDPTAANPGPASPCPGAGPNRRPRRRGAGPTCQQTLYPGRPAQVALPSLTPTRRLPQVSGPRRPAPSMLDALTMGPMTGNLFDPTSQSPGVPSAGLPSAGSPRAGAPLAALMRPRTLDEVVGQAHLVGPGTQGRDRAGHVAQRGAVGTAGD